MLQDSIARNLEIIGEATKNIPENIRQESNKIEWRKIAGLRDILIHVYSGIDIDVIWDILENKIKNLKVETILLIQKLNKDI